MLLTHFQKKTFEICCCAVACAEYTDEMFLLIFWKCICSRIWKFLCCLLMAYLFWSLTLFGDSEWMQRKIHNFIFSKNVDNFFYICSFFVAPLSTVTFSSCWFWDTIQSQPTYRCTTFWSPINTTSVRFRSRQLHQIFSAPNHHSPPKACFFHIFFQEH